MSVILAVRNADGSHTYPVVSDEQFEWLSDNPAAPAVGAVDLGAQWQRVEPQRLPAIGVEAWDFDAQAFCVPARIKAAAVERINVEAEAARSLFITPGAGQALTYQRKEVEARAWTEGAPDSDFPFLSAEAAASGVTVAQLAPFVVQQADAWVTVGSMIEALRRGAVVAIEAASTADELEAAARVAWPSA